MIQVFGYGSLVNRRTQSFGGEKTVLEGWRRVWVATNARPAAFLSVEPAEGSIEGLSFPVPADDLPDLDEREAQYDRIAHANGVVYSVPARNQASRQCPILRSYLDVVLQGYLREFGQPGVARFMTTTSGWENGLYDDRAAPIYPRAQEISPAETELFDAMLGSVPVVEELE
ncbi:MAG: gamma-glutamylcyclotransferase family protein [Pseudomonadota bacterium]